jgi:hypothetical protein
MTRLYGAKGVLRGHGFRCSQAVGAQEVEVSAAVVSRCRDLFPLFRYRHDKGSAFLFRRANDDRAAVRYDYFFSNI